MYWFTIIISFGLFGTGIGYYFFPDIALGRDWKNNANNFQSISVYLNNNKSGNADFQKLNKIYNDQYMGLKTMFTDGYANSDAYVIARNNYMQSSDAIKSKFIDNIRIGNEIDCKEYRS